MGYLPIKSSPTYVFHLPGATFSYFCAARGFGRILTKWFNRPARRNICTPARHSLLFQFKITELNLRLFGLGPHPVPVSS